MFIQARDSYSLEAATTPLILQYLRTLWLSSLSDAATAARSVTVPANEVWKVTINGRAAVAASRNDYNQIVRRYCKINGVVVASSESESKAWSDGDNDNSSASASTTFPINVVLVEGDVIAGDNTGLQIGGFVVN